MKKFKVVENLCTMKAGYWYPIFVKPTLPGDRWKISVSDVIRDMARVAPTYASEAVRIAGFYVQNKDLMDDWWKFRTGGFENNDTTALPYMLHSHARGDVGFGSLTDMLMTAPALTFFTADSNGVLQPNQQVGKSVCLVERAYAKIGRDWFMNQNLENEDEDYPLSTANGDAGEDTITNRKLFKCHWNHDFYTNQVPSQEKGPQAIIPIGSEAPVVGNGNGLGLTNGTLTGSLLSYHSMGSGGTVGSNYVWTENAAVGTSSTSSDSRSRHLYPAGSGAGLVTGVSTDAASSGLVAKLSDTTGIPISVINLAIAGQKVAVKLMRHGSRSVEWLNSMFGVKSSDARLDRSEFLGCYSTDIVISPIAQTSSTDGVSPQGNLAGMGFHKAKTPSFKCYCEEDGWIMILACIRPRTQYCQGMPAYYRYQTRWDFPIPAFAHLDYVPSKNSELKYNGITNGDENSDWDSDALVDNQNFGFHPIFQEWRSFPNEVHGEFLSTLRHWHEARIFDNQPQLSKEFIQADPTTRQFADENADAKDNYLCQFAFGVNLSRRLPAKGTPRYF